MLFFPFQIMKLKNVKLVNIVEGAIKPIFSYAVGANMTW